MSVGAVEAALAENGPSAELYASFVRQLSDAIHAIGPISLLDLGSSWRPFPNAVEYPRINRWLVLLALLLIATVAFYTQAFTIASETLAALHAIPASTAQEKLDRLGAFMRTHPTIASRYAYYMQVAARPGKQKGNDTSDPGAGDLQAVLSGLLTDLRAINQQKSEVDAEMFDITSPDALIPPWIIQPYHAATWLADDIIAAFSSRTAVASDKTTASLAAGKATPSLTDEKAAPLPSQQDYFSNLSNGLHRRGAGGNSPAGNESCDVDSAVPDPACVYVLTALVGLPAQVQAESDSLEHCKRIVFILGNWILPALYGLIGVTVFQMRRILNPMQPNLPPVRLLFRIALGLFAGIIVTWFWSPSGDRIAIGEAISITAFGAAFIVGYSSEIFFVLLDTAVEQMLRFIHGTLKPAT